MEVISIIVPFYKGNNYLKRLRYMLEKNTQGLNKQAELELILVNDSPGYIIDKDSLISPSYETIYVEQPDNGGIHKARIDGISQANGKYIILLDQDDIISEDAIASLYFSIRDTQYDCVFGNGLFDSEGQTKLILDSYGKTIVAKDRSYYFTMGNRLSSPGQCIILAESIPDQWKTNILTRNCSDDLFLWMLLFKKTNVEYLDKSIYYHIDTGNNVSNDFINGVESDYEVLSYLTGDSSIPATKLKIFKMRCDYRLRKAQGIHQPDISGIYPIIRCLYYISVVLKTMLGKFTGKRLSVRPEKTPFRYALEKELVV